MLYAKIVHYQDGLLHKRAPTYQGIFFSFACLSSNLLMVLGPFALGNAKADEGNKGNEFDACKTDHAAWLVCDSKIMRRKVELQYVGAEICYLASWLDQSKLSATG